MYCELFDAVMNKCHEVGYGLQVQTVVTDFEEAVLRASSFRRGVQNKGCFYHLTQSTWRKVQQLGLTNNYKTDENFRLFCRMMDGLAFLPTDFVSDGMDYLKEIVPQEAEEFLHLLRPDICVRDIPPTTTECSTPATRPEPESPNPPSASTVSTHSMEHT